MGRCLLAGRGAEKWRATAGRCPLRASLHPFPLPLCVEDNSSCMLFNVLAVATLADDEGPGGAVTVVLPLLLC